MKEEHKSMGLEDKYGITEWEKTYLEVVRKIRGTNNPPKWLYKHSKKKYGWKDNLARYWYEKYIDIPIGKFTYGYQSFNDSAIHSIGSFCSIGIDQHVVKNSHSVDYVSSWNVLIDYREDLSAVDRSIKIGNDIWIGAHSIIRSGVTIGDGAVIGSGSVITKDIAPYTVVVGNNRVIKQRFSDNEVKDLLSIKWWEWDDSKIFESMQYWSNIREFIIRYK